MLLILNLVLGHTLFITKANVYILFSENDLNKFKFNFTNSAINQELFQARPTLFYKQALNMYFALTGLNILYPLNL